MHSDAEIQFALGQLVSFHLYTRGIGGSIFWGIHATFSVAALAVLWRRGFESRPRLIQFLIIILIFLLSTIQFAVAWAAVMTFLQETLLRNLSLPMESRAVVATQKTLRLQVLMGWLSRPGGLLCTIGDLVILWRACSLWTYHKAFLVIPSSFVTASCLLSIVYWSIITAKPDPNTERQIFGMIATALLCGIAGNLIITAMVGYQAYSHRQQVVLSKFRTWKMLMYLTESGAVFCIIQIVAMALFMPYLDAPQYSTIVYVRESWFTLYLYVSLTYPAAVVLLVAYNHSIANGSVVTGRTLTSVASSRMITHGQRSIISKDEEDERVFDIESPRSYELKSFRP